MKTKTVLLTSVLILLVSSVKGQNPEQDSTYRKFYIGSSIFMLGNFIPDDPNPPDFIQLNFGYHLTPKDVIICLHHLLLFKTNGEIFSCLSQDYTLDLNFEKSFI